MKQGEELLGTSLVTRRARPPHINVPPFCYAFGVSETDHTGPGFLTPFAISFLDWPLVDRWPAALALASAYRRTRGRTACPRVILGIAMSLALREPKYQETAAYCHFGREPITKDGIKFFEWENAKDLCKYASMDSAQVEQALKGSNYLTKCSCLFC